MHVLIALPMSVHLFAILASYIYCTSHVIFSSEPGGRFSQHPPRVEERSVGDRLDGIGITFCRRDGTYFERIVIVYYNLMNSIFNANHGLHTSKLWRLE